MRLAITALLIVVMLLASGPAQANIGVPMIAVFLPALWLSIIPVILVEAWVIARLLPLTPRRAMSGAAIGNVLSTLIGIPLMWVLLATGQLVLAGTARGLSTLGAKAYAVTVQAPWLIPYEEDLKWMIPVALITLAVPAYVISVLIEWRCMLPFVDQGGKSKTLRVVAKANVASYVVLALLFAVVFVAGSRLSQLGVLFEPITMFFVDNVFFAAQRLSPPGR